MASPSTIVVVALALISLLFLGALDARELDCSSVSPSKLADYEKNCQARDLKDAHLSALVRLDMIEGCACQLLRRTFVWQSLLSHEVETLYQVAQQLVEDEKDKEAPVSSNNPMYLDDPSGRKYFWDKFALILENNKDMIDAVKKSFSEIYYQPDSYKIPFKSLETSRNLLRQISRTCSTLQTGFLPFKGFFQDLVTFSGNSRFEFRLANYDDSLYKIFTVVKMCDKLKDSSKLI